MYWITLFSFLDLQLSLPKKNHHCLAAVVTSDTRIKSARMWNDLQGESLINAWANFSIHPFEVLSVPHRNYDLSVPSFVTLLRGKRKPTNSMNFIPTDYCHLYPLPWLLFPSPPQTLMEPFLEYTRAYGRPKNMPRAQSTSGIPVDQVMLPRCAHSGLSRDHCSDSSAGQVFEAMHQRSGPHIFLNLLAGEPCMIHSQIWRALHTIQCFSWTSWNLRTMSKCCKFFYVIFLNASSFKLLWNEFRATWKEWLIAL